MSGTNGDGVAVAEVARLPVGAGAGVHVTGAWDMVRARWRRSVIQATLVELGMTQEDLAHLVGCGVGTISRSVTDSRRPTLSETVLIAQVLGLPLDKMIEVIPAETARPKSRAGVVGENASILHRRGTRRK